jgi:hypothetical protein
MQYIIYQSHKSKYITFNKKLRWVQFEKIIQFIIPKYALI